MGQLKPLVLPKDKDEEEDVYGDEEEQEKKSEEKQQPDDDEPKIEDCDNQITETKKEQNSQENKQGGGMGEC